MVEPGAIAPGTESFSHTQLDFVTDDAFLELQQKQRRNSNQSSTYAPQQLESYKNEAHSGFGPNPQFWGWRQTTTDHQDCNF